MNMTPATQLRALTNAELSSNGIGFRVERFDDASLDVWCPGADICDIIQVLCLMAATTVPEDAPHPTHGRLAAIPAIGMGFQATETPEKTLLVMRLAGIDLAFEVASSGLAAMADELSRIARTLAATGSRAN